MKTILKLLVSIIAVLAAILGFAYWQKATTPEYIEIYSDDEEGLF